MKRRRFLAALGAILGVSATAAAAQLIAREVEIEDDPWDDDDPDDLLEDEEESTPSTSWMSSSSEESSVSTRW